MKEIIETIKKECDSLHIPYNDKLTKDLVLLCPNCLKEGKTKIKLYIKRDTLTYHCFRCNIKGNIFTISKPLKELNLNKSLLLIQQYSYDVIYSLEHNEYKYFKSIIIKQIDEIINDEELIKPFLNIIKKNIDYNIKEINYANFNKNDKIDIVFKNYLEHRNISEYFLKMTGIPLYKGYNHNSNLYGRLILPTFMNTNYEARLIHDYTKLRYIKRKSNDIIFDFPMIIIKDKQYLKPKFNTDLKLDYIIITEGMFDSLTLSKEGINSISSGGYGNGFNVMMFIKILNKIFNIIFDNIIFIYDKDINKHKLNQIINLIYFYFRNEYNIKTIQLDSHKDINEIPEEEFGKFEYDIYDLIY